MRTKILTIVALLCAVVLTASAQARKRSAAGKPAAAAAKKAATPKPSGKFAILQIDEWANNGLFEDAENVYILDYPNGDANTLRAVNKKTGEVTVVVPRKTRSRAKILCGGADSTNVYLRLADIGIVKFNGTDVNTSEVLVPQVESGKPNDYLTRPMEGKRIITSPNGRYIALLDANRTTLVYDQEEKRVTGYYGNAYNAVLSNSGTLVYYDYSTVSVLPKGHPTSNYSDKVNQQGLRQWKKSEIGNGGGGEITGLWCDYADSQIYLVMGEQIMRSPMKQMKWEEAYVLPGENKVFMRAAFSQNHVLAETDNFEKHYYEWDNKKLEGTPTITKQMEFETDVTVKEKWTGLEVKEKISSVGYMYTDWLGNFWMQQGDGRFYIYNPDGIKGYAALKGKLTEHKLPPVD